VHILPAIPISDKCKIAALCCRFYYRGHSYPGDYDYGGYGDPRMMGRNMYPPVSRPYMAPGPPAYYGELGCLPLSMYPPVSRPYMAPGPPAYYGELGCLPLCRTINVSTEVRTPLN